MKLYEQVNRSLFCFSVNFGKLAVIFRFQWFPLPENNSGAGSKSENRFREIAGLVAKKSFKLELEACRHFRLLVFLLLSIKEAKMEDALIVLKSSIFDHFDEDDFLFAIRIGKWLHPVFSKDFAADPSRIPVELCVHVFFSPTLIWKVGASRFSDFRE